MTTRGGTQRPAAPCIGWQLTDTKRGLGDVFADIVALAEDCCLPLT